MVRVGTRAHNAEAAPNAAPAQLFVTHGVDVLGWLPSVQAGGRTGATNLERPDRTRNLATEMAKPSPQEAEDADEGSSTLLCVVGCELLLCAKAVLFVCRESCSMASREE